MNGGDVAKSPRWLAACTGMAIIALLVAGPFVGSLSRAADNEWTEPVNLSRSGSASEPIVVTAPDGQVQIFWWDRFDGMLTATWDKWRWYRPLNSRIYLDREKGVSLGAMPHIVSDGRGWAHAFWQKAGKEGATSLFHSRLEIGDASWSEPTELAESVFAYDLATDPAGTLHLAFVRTLHRYDYPAGVYHISSQDNGKTWSKPTVLYESVYFRLLEAQDAYVQLAANGYVCVTWRDPRLEKAFYRRSRDGVSWDEIQEIEGIEGRRTRVELVAAPQDRMLMLWQDTRMAACALYQRDSLDQGKHWGPDRRVLESLRDCQATRTYLRTVEGQPLLVAGLGSGRLTAAAWNGERWSEAKPVGFRFPNSDLGRQISLEGLRVAVAADGALVVAGLGDDGDIWAIRSNIGALELAFAPPSLWEGPIQLSQGEGVPGLPAVATDAEGRTHVLWSVSTDGSGPGTALYYARWENVATTGMSGQSRSAQVFSASEGKAEQPSLVAFGTFLHAVWSGGQTGEIFYSRANVREAYGAGGWSTPQTLPAPVALGSWPRIVADPYGMLHVVYAVPLNEGRGIYYTRSIDGGEGWSEAGLVFDAAAEDWVMVDHPTLAVDEEGTVHVAWVRASLPGSFPPQGIYYARSTDGGQTWSKAVLIAEGAYDWPQIVATLAGQVHLLWNDASGNRGWWQQWSTDSGEHWTRSTRVRGFRDAPGPIGAAADGSGGLHLVGLSHDDVGEPALAYTTWNGREWSAQEMFRLGPGSRIKPGVGMALHLETGRLHVALRATTGDSTLEVWRASRAVPAVEVTPAPTLTPPPTATTNPTPTPTPTLRPDLTYAPTLPGTNPVEVPIPIAIGGGTVAVVVVAVLATRALRLGRR